MGWKYEPMPEEILVVFLFCFLRLICDLVPDLSLSIYIFVYIGSTLGLEKEWKNTSSSGS